MVVEEEEEEEVEEEAEGLLCGPGILAGGRRTSARLHWATRSVTSSSQHQIQRMVPRPQRGLRIMPTRAPGTCNELDTGTDTAKSHIVRARSIPNLPIDRIVASWWLVVGSQTLNQ